MTLLDHAMNIAGFTQGELKLSRVTPGRTVTKVDWRGCMATERCEIDIGEVVRLAPSPYAAGRYQGLIVLYDKMGELWEPAAHLREVNGALEIWN